MQGEVLWGSLVGKRGLIVSTLWIGMFLLVTQNFGGSKEFWEGRTSKSWVQGLNGLSLSKASLERQQEGIGTCVSEAEWKGSQVVSKVNPLATGTFVYEPLWPIQPPNMRRNSNPNVGPRYWQWASEVISFIPTYDLFLLYIWLMKAFCVYLFWRYQ